MATQYLETYNPRAYVPGGSSVRKARAIQAKGRLAPVPKRGNPYVRPKPGGGSGATSPSSPLAASGNLAGVQAQIRAQAERAPVSTSFSANYESDPVLARIRALGQQNVANAETEAAALRKQAVIDTGLTDVGREVGVDDATLQAAQANPLSLLAQLNRESQNRSRDMDESLNQQNLFFSGYRANQLGELAQNQAAAQAELARDLRSALGGIDAGVLQARQLAGQDEQAALEAAAEAARQRDLEQALLEALYPTEDVFASAAPAAGGYQYVPEPIYTPPPLTPEEELMLALGGAGLSAFSNYAL